MSTTRSIDRPNGKLRLAIWYEDPPLRPSPTDGQACGIAALSGGSGELGEIMGPSDNSHCVELRGMKRARLCERLQS